MVQAVDVSVQPSHRLSSVYPPSMFCELETKVVLFAREIEDGGGGGVAPELTVSEKLVVLTNAPALPETTTVYVPAGVDEVVLIVRVVVQLTRQELGT